MDYPDVLTPEEILELKVRSRPYLRCAQLTPITRRLLLSVIEHTPAKVLPLTEDSWELKQRVLFGNRAILEFRPRAYEGSSYPRLFARLLKPYACPLLNLEWVTPLLQRPPKRLRATPRQARVREIELLHSNVDIGLEEYRLQIKEQNECFKAQHLEMLATQELRLKREAEDIEGLDDVATGRYFAALRVILNQIFTRVAGLIEVMHEDLGYRYPEYIPLGTRDLRYFRSRTSPEQGGTRRNPCTK